MFFSNLKKWENSLVMFSPEEWNGTIEGISTTLHPKENTIFFVKDKKYFDNLILTLSAGSSVERSAGSSAETSTESTPDNQIKLTLFKSMGLILERPFLKKLLESEGEGWTTLLLERLAFIAAVDSVDMAMANLSKPFYDLKMSNVNWFRDGRASGNAEIAKSAKIADKVFIGEHSKIGENVEIMSGAVVGPYVVINSGSVIYSNVSIYPWVLIGKNCRIHAGTVVGGDGFGYQFNGKNHLKVWHFGGVEIAEDVEIGSNSAIDAGTFSPTLIGKGTKIDNFVQVAHNCKIGEGVLLCGQVGVSGSVSIGSYSVLGGRAGIAPGVQIGDRCQVAGGALVNCDWPSGSVLGGHPARPLTEWMKGVAFIRKESLKKSTAVTANSQREEKKLS